MALAGEKGSQIWKAYGASRQGFLAAMTDKASDAVQIITSAIDAARSIGSTLWTPLNLSHLARAYAALGKFDEAWRCIGEAITAMARTKETWWEAEVHRIAGEISADVSGARCGKGADLFRARTRCRPPTTSQVLGTPRLP